MRIDQRKRRKNNTDIRKFSMLHGYFWVFLSSFLILSCIFYSSDDASINVATNLPVRNIFGKFGSYPADILMQSFGFISYLLLPIVLFWGFSLVVYHSVFLIWLKIPTFCVVIISACTFIEIFMQYKDFWYEFLPGGYIGYYFVNKYIGCLLIHKIFAVFILVPIFLLSLYVCISFERNNSMVVFNNLAKSIGYTKYIFFPVHIINRFFRDVIKYMINKAKKPHYAKMFFLIFWQLIKLIISKKCRELFIFKRKNENQMNNIISSNSEQKFKIEEREIPNFIPKNIDKITPKPLKKSQISTFDVNTTSYKYVKPSVELLQNPKIENFAKIDIKSQSNALLKALSDFGIIGEIKKVSIGPVVSLFEFRPKAGTKSSRVIGLTDDIARTMQKISTRISVIQGTDAIGIEIPNDNRSVIYFRKMIESGEFLQTKDALPIALGYNIAGAPIIVDLAKMPHLLIAGTTGSGKSVGINSMILSLLYKLSPDECQMIMIDPKMLELSVYDGIPHLMTPVITDPKKALLALKWVVVEMENRYKNMAKLGVRNITNYNVRVENAIKQNTPLTRTVDLGYNSALGKTETKEIEFERKKLPYIVIIVDEMADLMITAGKEVEVQIQRLAQMARASGIHIIMATQRPSVDVITGVIKANFPSRISFQVRSKIDSRTILGEQGAEQLLGHGDMLLSPGGLKLTRVHGPFVSDDEVQKIVEFIKKNNSSNYEDILENFSDEEESSGNGENNIVNKDEDIYSQAMSIVLQDKKTSISYLQRKLRIGYNKAANLIEKMESDGILSAPDSTGKRFIL